MTFSPSLLGFFNKRRVASIAVAASLPILINWLGDFPAAALDVQETENAVASPVTEPSPDPSPVAGQRKTPTAEVTIPRDLVQPLVPPPNLDPSQANFYQLPQTSQPVQGGSFSPTPESSPSLPQADNPSSMPTQETNSGSPAAPPVNASEQNANYADTTKEQPAHRPGNFPSESMIPEFNQPTPQVSAIVQPEEGTTAPAQPASSLPPASSVSAEQRLKTLEQSVFGLTYSEHDLTSRLAHLETETFGTAGTGSFEERLKKLEVKIGGQPAFERTNVTTTPASGEAPAGGAVCGDNEASAIVQAIPSDEKAGNYFASIRCLNGHAARWSKFPVRVHLPQASPEAWEKNLTAAIKKWNSCIPLNVVPQGESADIDVTWVNHLTPRLLGITRVVVTQGRMHVQIFMLRPTFYLPEVPERTLLSAFMHELGHGMGLLGHSDESGDLMYPMEFAPGSKFSTKAVSIGARDINTLKKVYELPGIESDYSAPAPMEWGLQLTDH